MRNLLSLIPGLLIFAACANSKSDSVNASDARFRITFPEKPVVMFDNRQAGKQVINYFNIIQTAPDEYRMYYIALDEGAPIEDFAYNLYIAWSEDLVNWHFERPGGGGELIMESVIEQYVCYVPGDKYPYRLVGNVFEDGVYRLCMWTSQDGVEFGNRKVVLEDWTHDSQCVLIPAGDHFKLYYRQSVKLGPGNYNRKVVLRYLDLEGNPVTGMEFIAGDYLYNSAASRIDDEHDLLIPTYFNNAPGNGDDCRLKAYVQHGFYSQEIDCPLNDWIEEDEKWVLAAPGIIHRDGRDYIAYNSRNTSHDQGCVDYSCFKLSEIRIAGRDDDADLHPVIKESAEGIQTADLLFVGLRTGNNTDSMADAIVASTGSDSLGFIHAAILEVDDNGKVWVIDATVRRGVARYPLDSLLVDFTPHDGRTTHFEVMRLQDNRNADRYIELAKGFVGEEYDNCFLPDNGKHYCTELIQDSYKNFGNPFFKSAPMNFKDSSGEIAPYWQRQFARMGLPVPQNVPGTNPESMHADKRLRHIMYIGN